MNSVFLLPGIHLVYGNMKIEFEFQISDFLLEGSPVLGKAKYTHILLGGVKGNSIQIIEAPAAV